MYADDVKLFYSYNNYSQSSFLQNDIDCFQNWCKINCIHLNLKKCKHMTFARRPHILRTYKIDENQLESLNSFVDLGVTMDPKLRFHTHINRITNKASSVLGFIKRWSKEFNDPYVTKLLFISLVRPILEYGSIVWCPRYNCYIDSIESVQKQFLLFCLKGLPWDPEIHLPPYTHRLQLIDLPQLKHRRIMLNICFVLKLIQGSINSHFLLSSINFNVPQRITRRYDLIHLSTCRLNYLQFESFRGACSDFNTVYSIIDLNDSINSFDFKKKILLFLSHLNS